MAITLDEAYYAIKTKVSAEWPILEPAVPVAFLNEDFQRDPLGEAWLLCRVEWTGGEQISIGAPEDNIFRRYGSIWFDAFVPIGTGQELPFRLAAEAAGIVEGKEFSEVVCYAMEPGAGASNSDDGLYFGASVNVPFYADDLG